MDPDLSLCTGGCSLIVLQILGFIMHGIYPVAACIAAICGAILGIVGVWRLIRPKRNMPGS